MKGSKLRVDTLLFVALLLAGMFTFLKFPLIPQVEASPIFSSGFESGSFSGDGWTGTVGSESIVTSPVHSGTYAAKFSTTGSQSVAYKTMNQAGDVFSRCYFYMATLPTTGNYGFFDFLCDSSVGNVVSAVIWNNGGTMEWGLSISTDTNYYVPATINAGQWYCVEIQRTPGSGNGIAKLWVDGSLLISKTAENIANNVAYFEVGWNYASASMTDYIDDVAVSNAYNGPISPPSGLSVTLNSPSTGWTSANTMQSFTFTPTTTDTLNSAVLWTNATGSWASTASNSSALVNNTQSTIVYTFSGSSVSITYIWNIQVFNSTTSVFAIHNFTLTITPPGVQTTIFSDGFETGNFNAWSGTIGTATIVTSPVHSGKYAAQFAASGSNYAYKLLNQSGAVYAQFYFYMATLPASGAWGLFNLLYDTGVSNIVAAVVWNNGGTMEWGLAKPSGNSYVPATINAGQWYCVEIERTPGSGNGIANLWVNGSLLISSTTETILNNVGYWEVGYQPEGGSGVINDVDDCVLSTSFTSPIGPAQPSLSVTLNNPSTGSTSTVTTQTFTYTPITGDTLNGATLWTNATGSWAAGPSNSTALVNNTQNSITYTFTFESAPMTYIWNIQVWNGTANVFATSNFTFSVLSNGTWRTEAPITYYESDAPAAVYNNQIYVFCGYNTSAIYINYTQAYDPSTNTWTQKAPCPYAGGNGGGGEYGACAATINDTIYVFGPSDLDYKYNCTTDSWTQIATEPAALQGEGAGAIVINNSMIYIFCLNQTYIYDPVADTFTAKAAAPVYRTWCTYGLVNVNGDDRVYVIGGTTGTAATDANYYYDVNTDTWSPPQPAAPLALFGTTRDNPVIGTTIYYGYGQNGAAFSSGLYSYNASDGLWSIAYQSGAYPRDGVSDAIVNGNLYIIGGRDDWNPYDVGLDYNEMFNFSGISTQDTNEYSVSVTVLPSSDAGTVNCNATGPYHYGDVVVLTESTGLGFTFYGWSGDSAINWLTGSTDAVTVTGNMAVTALFTLNTNSVFSVVSNSTVTQLAFNSTSEELSFTVSGPSGTTGFTNVTMAKTIISDISTLTVYLDGNQINYTVNDLITSWSIYFTYHHSTHRVVMYFASQQTKTSSEASNAATVAIIGLAIVLSTTLAITVKRKRRFSNFTRRKH